MRLRRLALATLAVLLLLVVAGPWGARRLLWRWELNPVLRGRLLAESQGCVACHGPSAAAAIPNPGSRWGEVPRLGGGNAFMYLHGADEIGETIRLGAPRAWLDDPEIRTRLETQRLRMPAFGDLSDPEVSDLTAWVKAVERFELPDDAEIAAGRGLAREHGCLSCHGIEGSGGLPNPGSLGGFIPGFAGRNFPDLVADEEEFREWIRTGTSRRLERNPIVRWHWRRQQISMPAYRDALTDQELDRLWVWVGSLRRQGR